MNEYCNNIIKLVLIMNRDLLIFNTLNWRINNKHSKRTETLSFILWYTFELKISYPSFLLLLSASNITTNLNYNLSLTDVSESFLVKHLTCSSEEAFSHPFKMKRQLKLREMLLWNLDLYSWHLLSLVAFLCVRLIDISAYYLVL